MKLSQTTLSLISLQLVAAQGGPWAQCGGSGWNGATSCVNGYICTTQNPYYHQCVPGTSTNPPPPSTSAPPPPPVTTTSSGSPPPPSTTGGTNPPTGQCPALPSSLGSSNSNLPDPFTFHNGAKVQTKADWTCRQREMSHLLQTYELGTLPPKPQSVTASYSGNTLTINVSDNGKSISFSVTISKPSGTSVPAIIHFGFASLPMPAGVASITFDNGDIAAQENSGSRGRGKFYTLYGASHSAGAMTAWAWGVARIIDALEVTPSVGINPARVGVTGCSRNGKGALVAGALEPRIALTLPEESGSGGSACWRISDWQKSRGTNVQTASQIITENVWLGPAFNTHVNNVNALPFDHHMLAGLVAPRALYVMENSDMEWLGSTSTYGCMGAARKQWEALGALDSFGYSQVGGNSHCSFPTGKQGTELNAFINKFLLGSGGGTTNIYRTEASHSGFSLSTWAPWPVPALA